MKEHIKKEMINKLTVCAINFHDFSSLRERLKSVVDAHMELDRNWKLSYKGVKHLNQEE